MFLSATKYTTAIRHRDTSGETRNQNAGLDVGTPNATNPYIHVETAQIDRPRRCESNCLLRAQRLPALTSSPSTANGAKTQRTNKVISRFDEFLWPTTNTQMIANKAAARMTSLDGMDALGPCDVLMLSDALQNPSWSYTLFNLAGAPFASNGCLNVNALGVEPFTCR